MQAQFDVRDIVFKEMLDISFTVQITAERDGIIAGCRHVEERINILGAELLYIVEDGTKVERGTVIAKIRGSGKQITSAEDMAIGILAKTSGIATAAHKAQELAKGKIEVVSGAWKKMPPEIKTFIREAIVIGGGSYRIAEHPFMYIDKNYVRIFKGISNVLKAAEGLVGHTIVVQLKGETGSIEKETIEAVEGNAHIIMVDTGKVEDALEAIKTLERLNKRNEKKVAFAGEVKIEDIPKFIDLGIDILDIGKEIVDAPLLDMKMDVI